MTSEELNKAVYLYPRDYAVENGELDRYRESRKLNIACKEAIEKAINEHYADNCLNTAAAVRQVADVFGYDRMLYVLAVTVQHKAWDGRFSNSNKEWAATVPVFEDKIDGRTDSNVQFVVGRAHPGLVDLFVRGARKAQAERAEQRKAGPEKKEPGVKPSILKKLKQPIPKNAPNISANKPEQEL